MPEYLFWNYVFSIYSGSNHKSGDLYSIYDVLLVVNAWALTFLVELTVVFWVWLVVFVLVVLFVWISFWELVPLLIDVLVFPGPLALSYAWVIFDVFELVWLWLTWLASVIYAAPITTTIRITIKPLLLLISVFSRPLIDICKVMTVMGTFKMYF